MMPTWEACDEHPDVLGDLQQQGCRGRSNSGALMWTRELDRMVTTECKVHQAGGSETMFISLSVGLPCEPSSRCLHLSTCLRPSSV
jgi:hypothetical protein